MRSALLVALAAAACGGRRAGGGEPGAAPGVAARPRAAGDPAPSAARAPVADAAGSPVPADASPRAAAAPAGPPRPDDWVDAAAAIPDAVVDLRYAGPRNVTGAPLYPAARCLLRRAVAARLARAAATLRAAGRRLVLWDCYRPQSVQLILWKHLPDPSHVARPRTAADGTPRSGSDHSRGAAVDVSLADAAGTPLAMPTDHDDPGPAARRAAARAARADARLLDDAMRAAGFHPLASEWWHFAAPDAATFPLSDRPVGAP